MLVSDALKRGELRGHYSNNYVLLPTQQHSCGKKVFIHKDELGIYKKTFASKNKHFGLNYVVKQIWLLKGPGLLNSLFHHASPISRMLKFEGGQIRYAAMDGNIYIEEINITGPLGVDAKHPAGVYKIKKYTGGRNGWDPEMNGDEKVDQIGHVKTKNLAVNGYAENLRDAARYMPDFIEHGFGKNTLNNSYSLFYVPSTGMASSAYKSLSDNLHIKDLEAAKKLASVFEQLSSKNQELNLTVHGSGHYVFSSALKKLNKSNMKLPNITVYYANATTNLSAVDFQRRQAGMKLSEKPPLINSASLQQQYLSGNIVSAPLVAARAKPSDAISIAYNSLTSLPSSMSFSLVASLTLGSARSLEREVIENSGQALQQGAKLVWNSVHKMMVRG